MKKTKLLSKIAFAIFAILVIQFIYYGIATSIQGVFESDSVIFHIPIAKQLAKLTFLPANLTLGLGFIPATAEAILSLFVLIHIPLNLFNVLALVLLFIFSKKIAEVFGLSKEMSIFYAVAISTLQSVLRWPLTQVSDIWLAVFFSAVLYLLMKPKDALNYYLSLGFCSGMLVGMKSSGLIFWVLLIVFFGKSIFRKINFLRLTAFVIPLVLFGFSWYIRNYILTGNPLYPVGFFFLRGDPTYNSVNSDNWSIVANIIANPKYIFNVGSAIISEFIIWAFSLAAPIYLLIKKNSPSLLKKLSWFAILTFIAFIFFFPAESLVSNMRHIYPLIIVTVLEVFLLFKNREEKIGILTLLGLIGSLMNLDYHPKLLILAMIPVFYLVFVNQKFFDKVEKI